MAGRQIIVSILGDASSFDRATKQATSSAGKFNNVLKGVGQGLGIAAFANVANVAMMASGAVIDFGRDSVKAASDLNETMTKSKVIFGASSDAMVEWASSAARSMGLSKRAALDASSGFAGLFQTVGIGVRDSVAMSTGITQIGADLASFFNTDVGDALAALKSGLAGESEPLRKFNVFLSETAVSAQLVATGVKKVGGVFTEAQKQTARYQLIIKQTASSQGDFAKTGDGLANTTRTLSAEMENIQAEVGDALLPVLRDLSVWARDDGVPALKTLLEILGVLGGSFGGAGDEVDAFRAKAQETGIFWQLTGDQMVTSSDDVVRGVGRVRAGYGWAAAVVTDAAAAMAKKARVSAVDQKKAWADLASWMLGEYTSDYDRALGIQEARLDLHNATTDNQRAEAYAKLQSFGALNDKEFGRWIGSITRLAEESKGKVRAAYLEAVDDIRKLRAAAAGKITLTVNLAGSGVLGGNIGAKADGGSASGLTWVGEKGPELLNLPGGSYVHSSNESARMASSGGSPVVIQLQLDGRVVAQAVDRHLYYEMARAPRSARSA